MGGNGILINSTISPKPVGFGILIQLEHQQILSWRHLDINISKRNLKGGRKGLFYQQQAARFIYLSASDVNRGPALTEHVMLHSLSSMSSSLQWVLLPSPVLWQLCGPVVRALGPGCADLWLGPKGQFMFKQYVGAVMGAHRELKWPMLAIQGPMSAQNDWLWMS